MIVANDGRTARAVAVSSIAPLPGRARREGFHPAWTAMKMPMPAGGEVHVEHLPGGTKLERVMNQCAKFLKEARLLNVRRAIAWISLFQSQMSSNSAASLWRASRRHR